MPWRVERSGRCPPSRPWAVVNEQSGKVEGCHPSEASARRQQAALYANEPGTRSARMADVKTLTRFEVKDADRGEVSAVFATFNEVDTDKDVTLPGAFQEGAVVPISAYGHGSHGHMGGRLPVGKGAIRSTTTEAILDGRFFMDTEAGRDTFTVVKEMGPLQEWSYGYDALEFSFGEQDGQRVRYLKRQKVEEVSPVLLGAGNTRTLDVKAAMDRLGIRPEEGTVTQFKTAIRPHTTEVYAGAWDASAVVAGIPDDATVSDLRSVFAWVDPSGEPEMKGSYRFPHHSTVDGPANIRALTAGIAVLNGARGGSTIPGGDRKGVYDHLAAHLRDADREPPELREAAGGSLKLNEEAAVLLVGLDDLLNSASRVVALRAEKGKTLSRVNAEILDWLDEDLRRLRSLLDSPKKQLALEHARAIGQMWLQGE